VNGGALLPNIHQRVSIYSYIRDRLDSSGVLSDSLMSLPDEAPPDPGSVRFVAGARDGAFGHHGGSGQATEKAKRTAAILGKAATKPTKRRLRKLYEAVSADDILDYIDPMIEELATRRPEATKIGRIASWLVEQSPDRGAVKVGIALLGITGDRWDNMLHEVGAHEEFTLYACVAFSNSRTDPEADIFRLARAVNGWGRIHCVERLKNTSDPAIKNWILREGFRNAVMYEYLAHIAATTGELATALDTPRPDRGLLTAAGEIIEALLMGGPAEDIDDYHDAAIAVQRWLHHMHVHAATVSDYLTVHAVQRFLDADDGWEQRIEDGWTTAGRTQLLAEAAAILDRPTWPTMVRRELDSNDRAIFWRADQAAQRLGIDTFDHHLAKIDADPLEANWFQAWRLADSERAEVLADRASTLLDLSLIASGPSTAIGLGPQFKHHAALGWTLQGLSEHPGVAPHLVTVGLRSASIQNRNAAIRTLDAWGPDRWNDEHRRTLEHTAATDPNDGIRQRATALLACDH
jgi:hypothetical protein